jgi:anti-anti-sigma factor
MAPVEMQGAVGVIRPRGPIDAGHCPALLDAVMEGFGTGRPMLVVDLHDVPLIDSAGLETLIEIRERIEAKGGAVKLASVNGLCTDILRVTGVSEQFEQFAQARQAVGSFAI